MSDDKQMRELAADGFKVAHEMRAASEYMNKPDYPIARLSPTDLQQWSERVYRLAMGVAALFPSDYERG
jgi:hypothetical protein